MLLLLDGFIHASGRRGRLAARGERGARASATAGSNWLPRRWATSSASRWTGHGSRRASPVPISTRTSASARIRARARDLLATAARAGSPSAVEPLVVARHRGRDGGRQRQVLDQARHQGWGARCSASAQAPRSLRRCGELDVVDQARLLQRAGFLQRRRPARAPAAPRSRRPAGGRSWVVRAERAERPRQAADSAQVAVGEGGRRGVLSRPTQTRFRQLPASSSSVDSSNVSPRRRSSKREDAPCAGLAGLEEGMAIGALRPNRNGGVRRLEHERPAVLVVDRRVAPVEEPAHRREVDLGRRARGHVRRDAHDRCRARSLDDSR